MIFLNFLTPFSRLTMVSFLSFPLQQSALASSILLPDFCPPILPSDHCAHPCCPIYHSTKTSLSAILCGSALPSPMAIFSLQFSIHHTTVTVRVSLLHKMLSFFFFHLLSRTWNSWFSSSFLASPVHIPGIFPLQRFCTCSSTLSAAPQVTHGSLPHALLLHLNVTFLVRLSVATYSKSQPPTPNTSWSPFVLCFLLNAQLHLTYYFMYLLCHAYLV